MYWIYIYMCVCLCLCLCVCVCVYYPPTLNPLAASRSSRAGTFSSFPQCEAATRLRPGSASSQGLGRRPYHTPFSLSRCSKLDS